MLSNHEGSEFFSNLLLQRTGRGWSEGSRGYTGLFLGDLQIAEADRIVGRNSEVEDRVVLQCDSTEMATVVGGGTLVPGSGEDGVADGDRAEIGGVSISTYVLIELNVLGHLGYMYVGMDSLFQVAHQEVGGGGAS